VQGISFDKCTLGGYIIAVVCGRQQTGYLLISGTYESDKLPGKGK
jgi:hypothetical protein